MCKVRRHGDTSTEADEVGMSDLLSPIYVVFDGNEADAFWGLVGVMEIMASSIRFVLPVLMLMTGVEFLT